MALERTTATRDDKKPKWKEVLVPSFASSEESGEEVEGGTLQDQSCMLKLCHGDLPV